MGGVPSQLTGGGQQSSGPSVQPGFGGGYNGGKNPPNAPDVYGAARATSQGSQAAVQQQTQANRPEQTTPFGSSQWTQDPATGQWKQNVSLAPGLQGAATGLQGMMSAQAGQPIPSGDAARQGAMSSIYNYGASRMDPQWAQRQKELNSDLINQGLSDSPQAARAQQQFSQERNDAYSGLEALAQRTGREAQAQNFAQDVTARELPYQQLGQLQGLSGMPGFQAAGQYAPANYLAAAGLTGQLANQAYQTKQGKSGGTAGAGADLLGTLGGLASLL